MTTRRYISFFRRFRFDLFKNNMSADNIKVLESKASEAEALAAELRKELSFLQNMLNNAKDGSNSKLPGHQALIKENENLKKEIERYKVLLSGRNNNCSVVNSASADQEISVPVPKSKTEVVNEKPDAPKKAAKAKPIEKKPAVEKTDEPPVTVGRLDFRVGKIVEVKKHPDAESLYVEQVDLGEAKPRTIVSGLVKHVPLEGMQNRMVIVLCNLKPAKMRGVTSEGMVMCASTPEKVEILLPPEGSVPGDIIEVEGFKREPDSILNPKKKIFETVAPELLTSDACVATYRGIPWVVPGKGVVKTQSLSKVNIK